MELKDHAIEQFLDSWCNELCYQLLNDPDGIFKRRHKALASNIGCDFPPVDVLQKYVQPVTSGSLCRPVATSSWTNCCPDLSSLAGLSQRLFGWMARAGDIQAKFKHHVWPGTVFRSLLQVWMFSAFHNKIVTVVYCS